MSSPSSEWRGVRKPRKGECNDVLRTVDEVANDEEYQEKSVAAAASDKEQRRKQAESEAREEPKSLEKDEGNKLPFNTRAQLEAEIARVEREMVDAGQKRDFATAQGKQQEFEKLLQFRERLPTTAELLEQLDSANQRLETCIKERQWQQAKSTQDLLIQLEQQLSLERSNEHDTEEATCAQKDNVFDHYETESNSESGFSSEVSRRRLDSYSSIEFGGAPDFLCDCLTVFLAAPLVWMDNNNSLHPFPLLNFGNEKKLLSEALKDAHQIGAEIHLIYEAATTDRLGAFLAADASPVLHFSGHGHPNYLAIENEGAMQALPVDQLREFIAAGSGHLQVVFVSACHSRPAGEAFLNAGVPHVVCCHQDEQLRDTAAIEFARNFYRALACGKKLKESFELAKTAVMVSPSVIESRVEMNKFLLLPEKPEDDPYHDVRVFYTKPMRNRSVSSLSRNISQQSVAPSRILPPPPEPFLGREVNMYKVLQGLKESRLVRLTGSSGSGKSSLAAAVCKYIHDRTRSFFLEDILWLSSCEQYDDDNDISSRFCQLFGILQSADIPCASYSKCCRKIVRALYDVRALIFIDSREVNSAFEFEKLDFFLQDLLRGTQHVKVVLICPSGQDVSSDNLGHAVNVALTPLNFRTSVVLFGSMCPHVSQSGRCPTVRTANHLADLLVPEAQADATVINKNMSKRCSDIFCRTGEGIPARIHTAATKISEKDFDELIRIGNRPEPRSKKIETRAQLDLEIARLARELDVAVQKCDFLRAQELQDTLGELQRLRENFPSLVKLKQMETALRTDLNEAISSRDFAQANEIQNQLNDVRSRISIEEQTANPTGDGIAECGKSATDGKKFEEKPTVSASTTEGAVSGDIADAQVDSGVLNITPESDLRSLKIVLDPHRDLDDALIEERMKTFAVGTREWAINGFDEWISDESRKHRVFVLAAQAGVGKTGIMCKLVRDRPDVVVAYHFCRHDDSRLSNPKDMLLSIAYQIATKIPEYNSAIAAIITERSLSREMLIKDHNVVALFELLLKEPLSQLTVNTRHAILIDALDECGRKNEILLCIQRNFTKLPPWLSVYVTARPEFPIIEKLKKFHPKLIEPEEEDNMNDLRIFFRQLLEEYGSEELSRGPHLDEAVETLVEKSGGLFIYASFLAEMIRSSGQRDVTRETLEQFPSGLDDFYEEQFTRMFPDDECLEWHVTKMVVAAAEPLHVELVQALTRCTSDERRKAVRKLSEFFPIDQNRKVHIYHKSLTDWLTADDRKDSEFYVDLLEEEKFLANRCLELLDECGITDSKDGGANDYHPDVLNYVLRHGVSHLCSAGMRHEARKLILDVRWLLARAEAGDAYEIVLDCQKLEKEDRTVELVGRAIGLALNSLRADPHQLPGQLIGRLLGSTIGRRDDDKVQRDLSAFITALKDYKFGFKWWCPVAPTWDQAEQPCLRTLIGHTSSVKSVVFSNDGTMVVSGSHDKTVRIWDAATGHCDRVLEGHTECVFSVSWLEDGAKIVSGSGDKTIRIWCASTGECEKVLMQTGTGSVLAVAWLEDGTKVLSGSGDKTVRIWNTETGECEIILEGHTRTVNSVAWSEDGTRVMSGSADKTVRIWRIATRRCEHVLAAHCREIVHSVTWSAHDTVAVTAWGDHTIKLWDTDTGERKYEHSVMGHSTPITSVAVTKDSTKLVSGSLGRLVKLWHADTGDCLGVLKGHTAQVYSVAWSADGTRVLSGSTDRTIRIWDASDGSLTSSPLDESVRNREKHVNRVNSIAWSHDGLKVASASQDKSVKIWCASTGECEKTLSGIGCALRGIAWSIDDTKLVCGAFDGSVRIWQAVTWECERILEGHTKVVHGVKWSNGGTMVISGSQDETARIWAVATGECMHVLQGHTACVNSVGWSMDDTLVGSGSDDKTIRIWDVATGACLRVLEGHTDRVYSVRWTQDGMCLTSRSNDNTVRVWDPKTGLCKEIIEATEYISVGIECDRFYRSGHRACGVRKDSSVNFFVLKE